MPFWQNTTVAPAFSIFSTISFSIFSSCFRKDSICSGEEMLILASTSVFSISSAASIRATFASSTLFGMPVCTTSLSIRTPRINEVSITSPPAFFSNLIRSWSKTSQFQPHWNLHQTDCIHSQFRDLLFLRIRSNSF